MTIPVRSQPALSFRARSLLAFVLAPRAPIDEWLAELDLWLARSPGFFATRPVMLDLHDAEIDIGSLRDLVTQLAARSVQVMALEGASPSFVGPGLPPLVCGAGMAKLPIQLDQAPVVEAAAAQQQVKHSTLIVDTPVRSGQSIQNPEGDVTLLKSVASGAEIIAGGSVHVYGTLRGRALAGVNGSEGARIFCHRLQAEMLSIGGVYRTADEMDAQLLGKSVQAQLVDQRMIISALD